ncbi:rRNA pseudouridine synthase [bacterium]|nr:rRNA pseudouridine synthase [bacterium]
MEQNSLRLNKFLASCGIASRRKADELIEQGKIKVNGKIVKELGLQINPSKDLVSFENKIISQEKNKVYIVFNKPKDCITTTEDSKDRKTVFTFVKVPEKIFPVGRLDRNSTGVLLLTNDGELANRMLHPSYKVKKTYFVETKTPVSQEDFENLLKGIELEDGKTLPCSGTNLDSSNRFFEITIKEGRNRQVRRMFEAIGNEVLKLDRIRIGTIDHEGLRRAEWRHLKIKELRELKKLLKMEDKEIWAEPKKEVKKAEKLYYLKPGKVGDFKKIIKIEKDGTFKP